MFYAGRFGAQETNIAIAKIHIGLISQMQGNRKYTINDVLNVLKYYFPGASIKEAVGVWEGATEDSIEVTIINCCDSIIEAEQFWEKIYAFTSELLMRLGQYSILVEMYNPTSVSVAEVVNTSDVM